MKLSKVALILLVALASGLIIWGQLLIGVIILVALFLNQGIYSASMKMAEAHSPPTTTTDETESSPEEAGDEELEFYLNATDADLDKSSGWDRWTMTPRQHHLERSLCFGGPPTYTKVFEYDVRGTAVLLRLIEDAKEDFDGKTYEVFNGAVVRAQIEQKCAERANSKITSLRTNLEEEISRLQSQVEWHDADAVLRFFVLANSSGYREYLWSEYRRLQTGYESALAEAKKLGAVWSEYGYYMASKDATEEQAQTIHKFQSNENLLRFGLTSSELSNQKIIMSILSGDTRANVNTSAES